MNGEKMTIPNLELNEWLEVLPEYQKEIIETLSKEHTPEEIIDIWIKTSGPENTAVFGGDGNTGFIDNFKNEISKFICGHPDYRDERSQYNEKATVSKYLMVSFISSSLGAKLGIAATIISPLVALTLYTIGKMSVNAYCKTYYESN